MSSSPNQSMQQDDIVDMPQWLHKLLRTTFFHKCSLHHHRGKTNELNRYCISCDAASCKNCISEGHHRGHDVLTIYRHVYRDVVPLNELRTRTDCSQIQTYKCNKKWVLSRNPLPHNGSGALMEDDRACRICRRKLHDRNHQFCFCSIACKCEAITRRKRFQSLLRAVRAAVNSEETSTTSHQGQRNSAKGASN